MKARNVLVLALAALLLISLAVLRLPGRVEAQQPGVSDKKPADLAKLLEDARKEAAKAKAEAVQLREQLALERQAGLEARKEAAKAQQRAEEALAATEAARRDTELALLEAKKQAERARYAADIQAAQAALAKAKEPKAKVGQKPSPVEPVAIEQAKANLVNAFNEKRLQLMSQLKRLDEDQHKMLAELEKMALHTQILERLERIERRLDRLEKSQPNVPQQPQKSP